MDEEDFFASSIEDEGRCRDMAGKGAAGVDVVAIRDLAPQESMSFLRQVECSRVLAEEQKNMPSEGGRIEAHGALSSSIGGCLHSAHAERNHAVTPHRHRVKTGKAQNEKAPHLCGAQGF
ncbi:hypothetical protein VB618_14085 [Microvirga sp. CF3062]|uniref:hypothetical protein n=1 Tax=Microvirga sp. CF3062 TaxID=3110182 RepID=UPI002E776768|nr:hypothetical protein [Microvirga sp. CF3062]MEE1657335.1 hypothetical protein [Microvirga sp. CF3062]